MDNERLLPELRELSPTMRKVLRQRMEKSQTLQQKVGLVGMACFGVGMAILAPLGFALGDGPKKGSGDSTTFVLCVICIVAAGFAAFVDFRSKILRRFLREQLINVCNECGYDLRGSENDQCPECGVVNDRPACLGLLVAAEDPTKGSTQDYLQTLEIFIDIPEARRLSKAQRSAVWQEILRKRNRSGETERGAAPMLLLFLPGTVLAFVVFANAAHELFGQHTKPITIAIALLSVLVPGYLIRRSKLRREFREVSPDLCAKCGLLLSDHISKVTRRCPRCKHRQRVTVMEVREMDEKTWMRRQGGLD